MTDSSSKRKENQGATKQENKIVTGKIDWNNPDQKFEIVTGEEPITQLELIPENIEALEFELLQSEQSLRHHWRKCRALRKIIKSLKEN